MHKNGIESKRKVSAVKKTILMLALFTAVFLFAGFASSGAYVDAASGETVLSVYLDGNLKGSFTIDELRSLPKKVNSYSAWDSKPEFALEEDVAGPSVEDILTSAEINMNDVSMDGTVRFRNAAGDSVCLTGRQLFEEERYFFPEGGRIRYSEGIIPEEAYENSEPVEAIISTDGTSEYGLYVGQAAPNEENGVLFIKGLAAGGEIDVRTAKADRCEQINTDPEKGTAWRPGKEIELTSLNQSVSERDKEKIYYTLDSSMSPGYGCPIYNYGPDSDDVSKPVFPDFPEGTPKERRFIYLKVIVKSYGKLDSKPQGFTFYVGDALTVKVDGSTVAAYEPDDFSSFPVIEKTLNFSGYNSYPSHHSVSTERAYDVGGIIEYATGKDISGFSENSKIVFTAWDGYSTELTFGQLFGTKRYYYPNAEAGTDDKGSAALSAAYEKKIEVPAVIDAGGKNTLLFGQVAPSDQNYSEYVSSLFTLGEIEIITSDAEQCSPVLPDGYKDGAVIAPGTEIRFPFPDESHKRDKLYYIVDPDDGELPGEGCAFYYYSANRWPKELVNAPVLNGTGVHTIKAKVMSYGKKDSEVYTLRYLIRPGKPAGAAARASSFNEITVSWHKQSDAAGYRVYRSAGDHSPVLITATGPDTLSFTDRNLNTGTKYTYQITAYVTGKDGTVIESERSSAVSSTPLLLKPDLKVKSGKKKAVIKWSMVPGASGYQVYRSTKKSKGYKKVKTVKNGKTVSFTNKKLKKGKKYYYKVRAYRTVGGNNVYSDYSDVKKVKVK